jgi:DNA-binding GntR family transcriptional regulator
MPKAGRPADSVERVYAAAKDLAVKHHFLPGARINEVDLARRLAVSRTPVREALNRLVRDGFLRFVPNRGFFARDVTPDLVRDLYELRAALEVAAVRLACVRAPDAGIADVATAWEAATGPDYRSTRLEKLARADAAFHMSIAKLSGNEQLVASLASLNEQIHYFRRVDQEHRGRREETYGEHGDILACLAARDADRAGRLMEKHIVFSREHALFVTEQVLSRIMKDRPTAAALISTTTAATASSKAARKRAPRSASDSR